MTIRDEAAKKLAAATLGLDHTRPVGDWDWYVKAVDTAIGLVLETCEAQGLVLVPKEPTEEMVAAGQGEIHGPEDCYRAMLAAAPRSWKAK